MVPRSRGHAYRSILFDIPLSDRAMRSLKDSPRGYVDLEGQPYDSKE